MLYLIERGLTEDNTTLQLRRVGNHQNVHSVNGQFKTKRCNGFNREIWKHDCWFCYCMSKEFAQCYGTKWCAVARPLTVENVTSHNHDSHERLLKGDLNERKKKVVATDYYKTKRCKYHEYNEWKQNCWTCACQGKKLAKCFGTLDCATNEPLNEEWSTELLKKYKTDKCRKSKKVTWVKKCWVCSCLNSKYAICTATKPCKEEKYNDENTKENTEENSKEVIDATEHTFKSPRCKQRNETLWLHSCWDCYCAKHLLADCKPRHQNCNDRLLPEGRIIEQRQFNRKCNQLDPNSFSRRCWNCYCEKLYWSICVADLDCATRFPLKEYENPFNTNRCTEASKTSWKHKCWTCNCVEKGVAECNGPIDCKDPLVPDGKITEEMVNTNMCTKFDPNTFTIKCWFCYCQKNGGAECTADDTCVEKQPLADFENKFETSRCKQLSENRWKHKCWKCYCTDKHFALCSGNKTCTDQLHKKEETTEVTVNTNYCTKFDQNTFDIKCWDCYCQKSGVGVCSTIDSCAKKYPLQENEYKFETPRCTKRGENVWSHNCWKCTCTGNGVALCDGSKGCTDPLYQKGRKTELPIDSNICTKFDQNTFNIKCWDCYCQKNGEGICTAGEECAKKSPLEDQVNKFHTARCTTSGKTTWKHKCWICYCTGNGKALCGASKVCTEPIVTEGKVIEKPITTNICPKQDPNTFIIKCWYCYCQKYSKAVCTADEDCAFMSPLEDNESKLETSRCTKSSLTTWKYKCWTCFCSETGLADCSSTKNCIDHLPSKGILKEVKIESNLCKYFDLNSFDIKCWDCYCKSYGGAVCAADENCVYRLPLEDKENRFDTPRCEKNSDNIWQYKCWKCFCVKLREAHCSGPKSCNEPLLPDGKQTEIKTNMCTKYDPTSFNIRWCWNCFCQSKGVGVCSATGDCAAKHKLPEKEYTFATSRCTQSSNAIWRHKCWKCVCVGNSVAHCSGTKNCKHPLHPEDEEKTVKSNMCKKTDLNTITIKCWDCYCPSNGLATCYATDDCATKYDLSEKEYMFTTSRCIQSSDVSWNEDCWSCICVRYNLAHCSGSKNCHTYFIGA